MSQIRHGAIFVFLLLMLFAVLGCSEGTGSSMLDSETGKHPDNWYTAHRTAYPENPSICQECHGTDLKGGISQVSCFSSGFEGLSCHADGPSGHPSGWSSPMSHGLVAKSDPGPSSGFSSCQVCHGDDFAGGAVNQSCFTCHGVNAPHPSSPWRESSLTHTNTNPANAVVCALCHLKPSIPQGTTPGCFNNTLCHGDAHAAGWSAGSVHGVQAEQDFSACTVCHGDTYQGTVDVSTSCYDCHNGPGLNHPGPQWVISDHAAAAANNSASCQKCHGTNYQGGGAGVACTICHMENQTQVHPANWYPDIQLNHRTYASANGTASCSTEYCHGTDLGGVAQSGPSCSTCHSWPFQGTHPGGWSSGSVHGVQAEQDFSACTVCHGDTYQGGAGASTSCYDCHNGPGLNHPGPQWVISDHAAAAANNSASCQKCHGTNYQGGGAGVACTICHMENQTQVHPANWYPDIQLNHRAYAGANGTASCSTEYCHGTDLGGVAQSGPSCSTCHSWPFQGTHPGGWSSGSVHGVQAEQDFSACTVCHGDTYQGGAGASTSCYDCHNGPGLNHPGPQWVISDHAAAAANNSASCQKCHGTNYQGGGSHVACTSCHLGNESTIHPVNWYPDIQLNHRAYASANGTASCATAYCHGTDLGGVAQSGPSCSTCHSWPYQGAHPGGWNSGSVHGVQAEQDFSACKTCHGSTYQGGNVASTSCYDCHNGPGLNHPAPQWVISNHATAATNNITSCQTCHGTNYQGGGAGVSCTSCHLGNEATIHPVNWYPDIQLNHRAYASANGTASCATAYCHGTDLGGVAQSGPSCSTCHSWPITSGTCTNCHGTPPDGSTFPNVAGRHSVHFAFNSVDCATCHQNAGSGTALHQNGVVNVLFSSTFNAKSGTALYNAGAVTCSTVSCHGGQTTPTWPTGTINVDTQCSSCHSSGTAQYNSYNSGRHSKHSSFQCTECHDTGRLQPVHFNDLNTTQMNEASQTIRPDANYSGGRCSIVCHNKTHSNFSW